MISTPSNVDFNTLITTGFYRLGNTTDSPNKPSIDCSYSNMIVARGGDTVAQIVFPYSDPANFSVRTGSYIGVNDSGWRNWAVYNSNCITASDTVYGKGNKIQLHVQKIDNNNNIVQFYVNGVSKGWINFDTSENVD